ncbi:Heparinase II/III-like protein [Rubrivivax sp. A210]|uniref:alginate lyase family protein n=1 Tax=Rubrivivax sp. A210 TaxID=2772301 RepID=UPI00191B32F5|nr:alginate lyase family protein [Rubrivivax sp. A210]CAD5373919.1 Heparinase II/III-like protein [Rubrivivax sp. A210]
MNPGTEETVFLEPWNALDDAALLAHFRGPRGVSYYPVADAEETRPEKIAAIVDGRFEFNGETHALAEPIAWLSNPSADVEWHILLHKFYYAVGLGLAFERSGDAIYVRRWVGLIDSWMKTTPVGFIAADVTGRRVQNWIYSLHLLVGHAAHDVSSLIPADFHRRLLESLHTQVEFLCANLTPKRNHRTLELYAIFLAGVVFPEMRRAAHWRDFALEQTVANLGADLLPDGVHCELSTDYHHLVLKNGLNFRRLAALNGVAVPAAFDRLLERGLEFSLHVHKPDGVVPSLSDGDARGFLDLLAQGAELFGRDDMRYVATRGAQGRAPARRVAHFDDSGYSVLRSGWGAGATPYADEHYLVFDHGPLGEGNHGHFDCLSFELAAHGRSLIVDPGRYTYSEAPDPADGTNWRLRFRGTAVHNTVCVDDRQQTSYLPKAIKPGTRHAPGTVRHKISGPAPEAALLERHESALLDLLHGRAASHEYDAVHERCIVFVDRRYWIVSDWLRAEAEHDYRLNFQLGAQAQDRAVLDQAGAWRLSSPGLLVLQPLRAGVQTRLAASWVSARYGDKLAAPALQSTRRARNADFDTVLMPWQGSEPALRLDEVAVVGAPAALRIALQVDGEAVTDHWFHARGAQAAQWQIAGFAFSGRWAWWRVGADGRLLAAQSHEGATLPQLPAALEPV